MSDDTCWECRERPRCKRPGELFRDTRCEECRGRMDKMTPEQRRQHNRDVFDQHIAAIDGGITGVELRGMMAEVARNELAKLRASRGKKDE